MKDFKLPISTSQELLLKTLVGKKSEALAYYNSWISSVNLDEHVDSETYKLMPPLFKRLESLGIKDKNTSIYKGIYKKSFFKNCMLLYNLQLLGEKLQKREISFTTLKGIPLIVEYLDDIGIRSMNDIDMVVDKKDMAETIKVLNELGYKSDCNYDICENLHVRHSYSFRNNQNSEIDLYWIILPSHYNDIKLNETKEILYKNISFNMLSCENFIIQTCIHAADWDPVFNIRWITDLSVILDRENNIDWQIILGKIKNSRFSYIFYLFFDYFNKLSELKVPEEIVNELKIFGNNKKNHLHARKELLRPKTIFGRLKWYRYTLHYNDRNIFYRLYYYPKYILVLSKYDGYTDLAKAFVSKYILGRK